MVTSLDSGLPLACTLPHEEQRNSHTAPTYESMATHQGVNRRPPTSSSKVSQVAAPQSSPSPSSLKSTTSSSSVLLAPYNDLESFQTSFRVCRSITEVGMSELQHKFLTNAGSLTVSTCAACLSGILSAGGSPAQGENSATSSSVPPSSPDLTAWIASLDHDFDGVVWWTAVREAMVSMSTAIVHPPPFSPSMGVSFSLLGRFPGGVPAALMSLRYRRLLVTCSGLGNEVYVVPGRGAPFVEGRLRHHTAPITVLAVANDIGDSRASPGDVAARRNSAAVGIYTGSFDRQLVRWDARRLVPEAVVAFPSHFITAMAVDAANDVIYVAFSDRTISAYPADFQSPGGSENAHASARPLAPLIPPGAPSVPSPHPEWVCHMALCSELSLLITVSKGAPPNVVLWTTVHQLAVTGTKSLVAVVDAPPGSSGPIAAPTSANITQSVYCPGRRFMCVGDASGSVLCWDLTQLGAAPTATLGGLDGACVGLFDAVLQPSLIGVARHGTVVVWSLLSLAVQFVVEGGAVARLLRDKGSASSANDATENATAWGGAPVATLVTAAWNPIRRELFVFASDGMAVVPCRSNALRPPQLGHTVVALVTDDATFTVMVVCQAVVHVFSILDGELLRSAPSPFSKRERFADASKCGPFLYIVTAQSRVAIAVTTAFVRHNAPLMRLVSPITCVHSLHYLAWHANGPTNRETEEAVKSGKRDVSTGSSAGGVPRRRFRRLICLASDGSLWSLEADSGAPLQRLAVLCEEASMANAAKPANMHRGGASHASPTWGEGGDPVDQHHEAESRVANFEAVAMFAVPQLHDAAAIRSSGGQRATGGGGDDDLKVTASSSAKMATDAAAVVRNSCISERHSAVVTVFEAASLIVVARVRTAAREVFTAEPSGGGTTRTGRDWPREAHVVDVRNAILVRFFDAIAIYNFGTFAKMIELSHLGTVLNGPLTMCQAAAHRDVLLLGSNLIAKGNVVAIHVAGLYASFFASQTSAAFHRVVALESTSRGAVLDGLSDGSQGGMSVPSRVPSTSGLTASPSSGSIDFALTGVADAMSSGTKPVGAQLRGTSCYVHGAQAAPWYAGLVSQLFTGSDPSLQEPVIIKRFTGISGTDTRLKDADRLFRAEWQLRTRRLRASSWPAPLAQPTAAIPADEFGDADVYFVVFHCAVDGAGRVREWGKEEAEAACHDGGGCAAISHSELDWRHSIVMERGPSSLSGMIQQQRHVENLKGGGALSVPQTSAADCPFDPATRSVDAAVLDVLRLAVALERRGLVALDLTPQSIVRGTAGGGHPNERTGRVHETEIDSILARSLKLAPQGHKLCGLDAVVEVGCQSLPLRGRFLPFAPPELCASYRKVIGAAAVAGHPVTSWSLGAVTYLLCTGGVHLTAALVQQQLLLVTRNVGSPSTPPDIASLTEQQILRALEATTDEHIQSVIARFASHVSPPVTELLTRSLRVNAGERDAPSRILCEVMCRHEAMVLVAASRRSAAVFLESSAFATSSHRGAIGDSSSSSSLTGNGGRRSWQAAIRDHQASSASATNFEKYDDATVTGIAAPLDRAAAGIGRRQQKHVQEFPATVGQRAVIVLSVACNVDSALPYTVVRRGDERSTPLLACFDGSESLAFVADCCFLAGDRRGAATDDGVASDADEARAPQPTGGWLYMYDVLLPGGVAAQPTQPALPPCGRAPRPEVGGLSGIHDVAYGTDVGGGGPAGRLWQCPKGRWSTLSKRNMVVSPATLAATTTAVVAHRCADTNTSSVAATSSSGSNASPFMRIAPLLDPASISESDILDAWEVLSPDQIVEAFATTTSVTRRKVSHAAMDELGASRCAEPEETGSFVGDDNGSLVRLETAEGESELDTLADFKAKVERMSPFFSVTGGIRRRGEPVPTYSETPKRRMTPLIEARVECERADGDRRRREKRLAATLTAHMAKSALGGNRATSPPAADASPPRGVTPHDIDKGGRHARAQLHKLLHGSSMPSEGRAGKSSVDTAFIMTLPQLHSEANSKGPNADRTRRGTSFD